MFIELNNLEWGKIWVNVDKIRFIRKTLGKGEHAVLMFYGRDMRVTETPHQVMRVISDQRYSNDFDSGRARRHGEKEWEG